MPTAHFNIGSNLGNRLAQIGRAVALLEADLGATATVSEPIISEPWGFSSSHRFVNVGVNIDTDLSPAELLEAAMRVERAIDPDGRHRTESGDYSDRRIDIDLICLGSTVSESAPQLPHPRLHLREFVLRPLMQLLPQWRHPLLNGTTPAQLLDTH